MRHTSERAITLLELMVVVMIIGILSSIAVTVYTGQVEKARIAACRDMIYQLELAITSYQVDTGDFPPGSSGTFLPPAGLNQIAPATGCGYLQTALLSSLSGDVFRPLDPYWKGPYLELDTRQLGDIDGSPITSAIAKPQVQILDPWGSPFVYLNHREYGTLGGTERPDSDPYAITETWYNITSFQIYSVGPNGITLPVPDAGTELDDVNNW